MTSTTYEFIIKNGQDLVASRAQMRNAKATRISRCSEAGTTPCVHFASFCKRRGRFATPFARKARCRALAPASTTLRGSAPYTRLAQLKATILSAHALLQAVLIKDETSLLAAFLTEEKPYLLAKIILQTKFYF